MRLTLFVLAVLAACSSGKTSAEMREKHEALCTQECACTGCDVASCVERAMELRTRQAQRNCAGAGDAITLCKLEEGGSECERAGSLAALMPTDRCMPQLEAFADCLRRNPNPDPPKPQPVSP